MKRVYSRRAFYYNTRLCFLHNFYLLACLIEAADKVANTASVYEAFLKQLKPSASKELTLVPLNYDVIEGNHMYLAFNEDAEELLSHVKGDILYL